MTFSTAAWRGVGERRVRVDGNRVACWRIGSVDLERCQECEYLRQFEVTGAPPAVHVVCADTDLDAEPDFAW